MRSTDTTERDKPSESVASRWAATLRVLFCHDRIRDDAPIVLPEGETSLGRSVAHPGIVLDDSFVSRTHARIQVDTHTRRAQIINESRSGTLIEATSVERAELSDGAVFFVGHTALLFRWQRLPEPPNVPLQGLIGSAPSMRAIRTSIVRYAPSDAPVMILGETGVGKDVAARALHQSSGRDGPFIAVNSAAIPPALAESQLFGHIAGAFTDARAPADGFLRAAGRGTLFLDEVGELPLAVQAKLLRALETRTVAPVGTYKEVPHHARVLTATHRDLAEAVQKGSFRKDLYARISDLVLTLPPLRERREDVLPLLRNAWGRQLPTLEFGLVKALLLHPWPFNVRELERLTHALQIHATPDTTVLQLDLLRDHFARTSRFTDSESIQDRGARTRETEPPGDGASEERARPPDRDTLVSLLVTHKGVVTDLARAVGRSRKQVYRWLDAHNIDPTSYRR